ncbi:hypothetical protein M422DRAFT_47081 [Sphaerobolus stellatus SS14]|uniref:Transcription factor IIIC 90kDa subunit N-terminal domain-containing protein n=1 Tax=Sphaerobolus stellatus (strain SS14) TaxID=990650 RepID=A0A0C9UQW8_SPHS4|nr:hypothetical protein M422DRAFT_47081 [Sphaerobolus stellatus SS14]
MPANKTMQGEPLGWYRNLVELDRTIFHSWAFDSNGRGTIVLGSMDMSWDSIAISPTNIGPSSCCVFAALNTDLEVSLWAPVRNYLTGQWHTLQDLTQVIKDAGSIDPSNSTQQILNAQIQIPEGQPFQDGSLLALGNRAGRVIFLKLSSYVLLIRIHGTYEMQFVNSLEVGTERVGCLAWSSWTSQRPNHSDETGQAAWSFDLFNNGTPVNSVDESFVTGLMWLESARHAPILAWTKPDIIYLYKTPSDMSFGWEGAFKVDPSMPYSPTSGIIHYPKLDSLLVTLFDGSFYMIHQLSITPSLTSEELLSSEDLTRQARTVFSTAEGKITFADANRTSGVFSYDDSGNIGGLHERTRPDDFSYQGESQHNSKFIISKLWKTPGHMLEEMDLLLNYLSDCTASPTGIFSVFKLTPI